MSFKKKNCVYVSYKKKLCVYMSYKKKLCVYMSYKKRLCVYMSFNIKRHIYTSVISWCLDTIMKCGWTRFFLRSYILWCSSVLMNFPPVNHIYHEITGPYGWWFNILFFFNCLAATQLARQLHWHQERTQIDQKKPLPPGRFPIYYFPWSKPGGKGLPSK